MINLGNHFSHNEKRHSEWARQQKWFIKAQQDREKKDERAEKIENDDLSAGIEMIVATEQQIQDFTVKLDTYDGATVAALMENQKQLEVVRERLDSLLERAYVMEDGRRVFKTEDGTQVFDEFGKEVTRDELDFDLIGPDRPTLETFLEEKKLEQSLLVEREEILEYKEKIEEARDEIADGNTSEAKLEKMSAELEAAIPPSVRKQLPDSNVHTSKSDIGMESKTATLSGPNPLSGVSAPALN